MIPSSIQAIQDELFFADAFLFGLKDLSVHFEHTYTLDELKPVIDSLNKQGKQVFLSCNKNYDRHDLNLLSETLNEIERAILIDHIAFQGKMTELDKKFPVCRMTLQRMKKRLLTKLRSKYQK